MLILFILIPKLSPTQTWLHADAPMFGKEGLLAKSATSQYREYNVRLTSSDGSADNNAYLTWETDGSGASSFGIFSLCDPPQQSASCFYLYQATDGSFRFYCDAMEWDLSTCNCAHYAVCSLY